MWNDDLGDEYDEEGDGGAEHGGDDIYGGGMEGDDGPINMVRSKEFLSSLN